MDEDEHGAIGVTDISAVAAQHPELGRQANWSVSSHKYGFGVDNLRDGNDNTFWQSEGPQPHSIDLSFPKRVFISSIAILTSHLRDDSYTPSRISIRAGTGVHDLQEVQYGEFIKPEGWILIRLRPDSEASGPPIPAHHVRIVIVANHLNGKDTHVRGVKVFGPPEAVKPAHDNLDEEDEHDKKPDGRALLELGHDGLSGFTSLKFKMHETIR